VLGHSLELVLVQTLERELELGRIPLELVLGHSLELVQLQECVQVLVQSLERELELVQLLVLELMLGQTLELVQMQEPWLGQLPEPKLVLVLL
jgi:hypothetical protein